MQEEHISIREWQEQYKAGAFSSRDRAVQIKAGWYDWLCKDEALAGRLKKLAPVILGITNPYILDHYYLWLKNNCPIKGPLYDDVRFEPLEGERNGKYFLITRDSPHESKKWTLTTERYGFDAPEFECGNVREMIQYVNRLGYELSEGTTPEFIAKRREGILYIAYGSNLNLEQMKHRCPTATVEGASELKDYKMTFHGGPHGGVATVEPGEGSSVPVLVWRIFPRDEKALDAYEGWPRLYRKETMTVTLNGKPVEAMIYIMNNGYPHRPPSSGYYQTILEGYKSAGFAPEILRRYAEAEPPQEEKSMTGTVREQILAIRDTGLTNMFDVKTVQVLAYQRSYFELVAYLDEHPKEYCRFILTGEES